MLGYRVNEYVNLFVKFYFYYLVSQVPNLFEPEEYAALINGVRPHAKEAGVPEHDR